MLKRTANVLLCLLTVICLLNSCTDKAPLQPRSGGAPYEVLVVGADSSSVTIVASALKSMTMEGLPQREAIFDVTAVVAGRLNQSLRYARNIIMVTLVGDPLTKPSISYERNTYARQQLIMHVKAAAASQLKQPGYLRTLAHQLVRHELQGSVTALRKEHNQQAADIADSVFGIRLWVPEELSKQKLGKDFVWFSNDNPEAMLNICVYRYRATKLSATVAVRKRDSIMQRNLPGESDGMYMTTNKRSVQGRITPSLLELRGLWEMKDDAMGGPFVSHSMLQGDSILTVEAFVYAPSRQKRNLLRRMEAALYTVKEGTQEE